MLNMASTNKITKTEGGSPNMRSSLEADDACDISYRPTVFGHLQTSETCDSGVCMSIREDLCSTSFTSVEGNVVRSEAVTTCEPVTSQCQSLSYGSVTDDSMDSCESDLDKLHIRTKTTSIDDHSEAVREQDSILPPALELYRALFNQDEDGDTKLHLAIIQPDVTAAMWMIAAAAPCRPTPLNLPNDQFRQTPLHLAVLTNQPRLVRLLHICGVVTDVRDRNGNTPLHLACIRGQFECIQALTSPVTNSDLCELDEYCRLVDLPIFRPPPCHTPDLGSLDYEGRSYLHLVQMLATPERQRITDYLVNCGANLNIQDGKSGHTVLHLAVKQRDVDFVRYLCRSDKLSINVQNYNRNTALDLARCLKHEEMIELLRSHGAIQSESFSQSDSKGVDSSDDDTDDAMDEYDDLVIGGQRLAIH